MPEVEKKINNYEINFIRLRGLNDQVLLTTDHGGWAILDQEDYNKMLKYEISGEIYNDLLSKGIILTPESISSVIGNYKKRVQYFFGGTTLHLIIATTRCNQ